MKLPSVAIVGSGPSALMAAELLRNKFKVTLFDKRPAAGWKLLVAGSSGLNVTNGASPENFVTQYSDPELFREFIRAYSKEDWLNFLERMGQEPFLGTSNRYFVKEMTAGQLVKSWIDNLKEKVNFRFSEALVDFEQHNASVTITTSKTTYDFDYAILGLGGPSWDSDCDWPNIFEKKQIRLAPFIPANCGYHIDAPEDFFKLAEGKPIKGLKLTTSLGSKVGELMITRYGLEGTPIYTLGIIGEAVFDLKPDIDEQKIASRLAGKGPILERVKRFAKLSEGSFLFFAQFCGPMNTEADAAHQLKNLKVKLTKPRPITESISCKGGVSWHELNINLSLKKFPHVFCVGEMIDWHAPTGGFLIQGCVSMGAYAAKQLELLAGL